MEAQSCNTNEMPFEAKKKAKVTYPTGNKNFAVLQAFPSAFNQYETDPFLMCDEFGPTPSAGISTDPDSFPVGWHPHRGMDIVTYLKKGVGRHADSLGNRESFNSPGMQWISVGNGIEHAEGGGTPKGEIDHGFQIWVNVPSTKKMDNPRYGTESTDKIPILSKTGFKASILAGEVESLSGPFKTVQNVQIIDLNVDTNSNYNHFVPSNMDTCILHCYEGEGKVGDVSVSSGDTLKLDATKTDSRLIKFISGNSNFNIMIFAGKRLNEQISWGGPIVMNTEAEVKTAMSEYR